MYFSQKLLSRKAFDFNSIGRLNVKLHGSFNLPRFFTSDSDQVGVFVPALGDSISEGTLVEWTKGEKETCFADDIVAVIETDKVSVDVRAPVSGTIDKILVDLDENVVVGDTLCQMKPGDVTSTEEVCDSLIERDSEKIVAKDDDGVGQKSDSVQNSRPPDSLFQASIVLQ